LRAVKNVKADALRIDTETYNKVFERDSGCVLCKIEPHKKRTTVLECHHFVSRAKLGMGIEQNLIMLCTPHHQEASFHKEFLKLYLKRHYKKWKEEDLIFSKDKYYKEGVYWK